MSDKDPRADFLTVKKFAELVGMTPSRLRHYDDEDVFVPAMRSMLNKNNDRLYSPTQIITAKMIRVLSEIGVPLKTIKKLKKSRTPVKLIKLLSKYNGMVADEVSYLQEVLSVINVFIDLLVEGISVTESEISLSNIPERRIILGDKNDFTGATEFYGEFMRFCNSAHDPKINTSYPIGAYWPSMDTFMDSPSLPMRFYSLDPNGDDKRAADLYLTGYTRGYYGNVNDLPERMAKFAKDKGLVFSGPVYGKALFDELSEVDPEQYLFQVAAAVTETKRVPSRRPKRQYKVKGSSA
jgi:DNA-binding transcriptional MerR regulator